MAAKPILDPTLYTALPPSGAGKGVLVIHAWWGLNAFCQSVCERLALAGYVTAAPDLYGGQVAATIADAQQLRDKPKREPTYQTLMRAVEQLAQHPAVAGPAIGVVGFSMGAHWAFWLSQRAELPIKAVVAFYGARGGDYSQSRAAFMGHFAETDAWVSPAAIKKLQRSLEKAGRPTEFFSYPGTGHWFFESDRPEAYHPEAAELAWERTIRFLDQEM